MAAVEGGSGGGLWTQLTQLLGLPEPQDLPDLNDPTEAILSKTVEWIGEQNRAKMEQSLRTANLEARLKGSENRVKVLESELQQEREQMVSFGEDKNRIANLTGQLEASQSQVQQLQTRINRLESERSELQRQLDHRQVDVDRLQSQHGESLVRLAELRQASLQADQQMAELQARLSQCQLQLTAAQVEARRERELATWQAKELDRALAEHAEFRRNKAAELATAQAQRDTAQADCVAAEEKATSLRSLLTAKEAALEEVSRQRHALATELAERESRFTGEVEGLRRTEEALRRMANEATSHAESLQHDLLAAQEATATVEARIAQATEELRLQLEQARNQLSQRDEELQQLRQLLDEATLSPIGDLSPSASAVQQAQRTGRSLADVYSETVRLRAQLLSAEQEKERLRTALTDICADIEQRVPVLQAERRELTRMREECQTLLGRVHELEQKCQTCEQEITRLHRVEKEHTSTITLLEQQRVDLGRQVQSLLAQLEGVDQVEVPTAASLDAEGVITTHLVTFRSVKELQVKNQELLAVVRKLSAEAEEREKSGNNLQQQAELQSRLQEAERQLEEMRQARVRQTALVESLIKQQNSQQAFDRSQSRTTTPPPIVNQSPQEMEKLRQEISQLRVAAARTETDLKAAQERLTSLQQTAQLDRQEAERLRASLSQSQQALSAQQGQLQSLMADLLTARESEQRKGGELAASQAQLYLLRQQNERLEASLTSDLAERERLSRLLTAWQASASEREAQDLQQRKQMTEQLAALERELAILRQRMSEEQESSRKAAALNEREYRDLVQRHELLNQMLAKAREEAVQATCRLTEANRRIQEIQESRSSSIVMPTHLATSSSSDQELRLARERAEGLNRLLEESQQALEQLALNYEQHRQEHAEQLSSLHEQIAQLQQQLETHRQDMDEQQSLKEQLTVAMAEIERLESLLKEREQQATEWQQESQQFRSQLSTVTIELDQTRQELTQQQSRMLDQLRQLQEQESTAKEQSQQFEMEIVTLRGQLEQQQAEHEQTQKRLVDLDAQNSILLAQLEDRLTASSVGGTEKVSEIVRYLRSNRDQLQQQLDQLNSEHRRLVIQHQQLDRMYQEVRGQLEQERATSQWHSQMASEYEALKARLESITILREANQGLRAEVERLGQELEKSSHAMQVEPSEEMQQLRVALEEKEKALAVMKERAKQAVINHNQAKSANATLTAQLEELKTAIAAKEQELRERLEQPSIFTGGEEIQAQLMEAQQQVEFREAQLIKFRDAFEKNKALKEEHRLAKERIQTLENQLLAKEKEYDLRHKMLSTSLEKQRLLVEELSKGKRPMVEEDVEEEPLPKKIKETLPTIVEVASPEELAVEDYLVDEPAPEVQEEVEEVEVEEEEEFAEEEEEEELHQDTQMESLAASPSKESQPARRVVDLSRVTSSSTVELPSANVSVKKVIRGTKKKVMLMRGRGGKSARGRGKN